jgi:hypothetical protein
MWAGFSALRGDRELVQRGCRELFSPSSEAIRRPQDALDQLLASSEAKPGPERLTLIRIFEALRGLAYEGGYDAVRRYARVWQRDRAARSAGAFIPLSFAPGEASQFDWSH